MQMEKSLVTHNEFQGDRTVVSIYNVVDHGMQP